VASAVKSAQRNFSGKSVTYVDGNGDVMKYIFKVTSAFDPGEYFLFDGATGKFQSLGKVCSSADVSKLIVPEYFTIKLKNKQEVEVAEFKNGDLANTDNPVMYYFTSNVNVHNGIRAFNAKAQYFASLGFTVVMLDAAPWLGEFTPKSENAIESMSAILEAFEQVNIKYSNQPHSTKVIYAEGHTGLLALKLSKVSGIKAIVFDAEKNESDQVVSLDPYAFSARPALKHSTNVLVKEPINVTDLSKLAPTSAIVYGPVSSETTMHSIHGLKNKQVILEFSSDIMKLNTPENRWEALTAFGEYFLSNVAFYRTTTE
jgi:hypothetical protein